MIFINNFDLSEKILTEICIFLKKKKTKLSENSSDGRLNSAINEDEILSDLESYCLSNEWFSVTMNLKLVKPKARSWYDFAIESEDRTFFLPVNIKVSECHSADNLNCKLGLYYALTGLIPDFNNGISWEDYFEKLYNNIDTNMNNDYYFLIVDKKNRERVFYTSLKTINTLSPNGNNLPFQCKWDDNIERNFRCHKNSKTFLLTNLGESIRRRGLIVTSFCSFFPEYYGLKEEVNNE